jgi:hypothetical protein
MLAALALLCGRVAWLAWRRPPPRAPVAFAWYVLGVGMTVLVAFSLVRTPTEGTLRYVLLLLLIPVGLLATWLALEPRRTARAAGIAVVAAWAAGSAVDHARLARRYLAGAPNNPRVLVDTLEARGVTVARAPYWTAYKISFLSGERIRIASLDVARIDEYQSLPGVDDAPIIRLRACEGGEPIGVYYLCR